MRLEQADVYGIGFDQERADRAHPEGSRPWAPLGPIRLGICGAGGVAQCKYLPAINRLRTIWEPVMVAAIAEPRQAQGEKVAAIYGCRRYADWQTMLASEALDGVLVTTPDPLHAEIALACLEAGLPVMVEKPIARSWKQSNFVTKGMLWAVC